MKRLHRWFEVSYWVRHSILAVMTLAVIVGRLLLDPWWGHHQNRHLVFLPTVMLAAWLGGLSGGLLSAVMCTVALDYFWTEPRHLFAPPTFELFLFFLVAASMSKLIDWLHQARARADAARESHEQVLAIVAHDLRNPLATIKTTVTLIRRTTHDPDQIAKRLDAIDRAADRSSKLILDLVDATRAERDQLVVTLNEENLQPIIVEVAETFGPAARAKDIALEATASSCDVVVSCDRDRLIQVLGNLLGNALKFTPAGGHVTLRACVLPDRVDLEVVDTGTGISPEHLPHIFERYWHGDRRGTGLGLFIAQSIVRAHGSQLTAQSDPGRETRFQFSLRRPARPQSTTETSTSGQTTGGRPYVAGF